MKIERAIRILLGAEITGIAYERELAAGAFASWINSSDEDFEAQSGFFVVLNRIWALFRSEGKEIEPLILKEFYDPVEISHIIDNHWIAIPYKWQKHEFENYNEIDYIADIVRFMLTYNPPTKDRRLQASLGRAYEFINKHGGFDRPKGFIRYYKPSPATHQQQWKMLKRSASFQFVRSWGSSIDWYIDPQADGFLQRIADIANDRGELIDFFGKVKWTQQKLIERIDPRSMTENDFIELPTNLKPVAVKIPKFPKRGYEALEDYKRNRAERIR
ncbi:hypothetical protein [Methylobacterium sp. SI9]|uniref:hypothetical protein n=1 Tax=Methylobacterium guangdongense TaxID=3138811 RepID=UPI00313CB81F